MRTIPGVVENNGDLSIICFVPASDVVEILSDTTIRKVSFSACAIPGGVYDIRDGLQVVFRGNCSSITDTRFVIGSRTSLVGEENAIVNQIRFTIKADAKNSKLSNLGIVGNEAGVYTKIGITFGCSATSVPERIEIKKCHGENLAALYEVRGARKCAFIGNSAYRCERSFIVYSADRCRFVGEKSEFSEELNLPIVGFLNIATRDLSLNRGITNCTYRDISIDGWKEEGFSFDGRGNAPTRRSYFIGSHVASVSLDTVTLVAPISFDCSGLMLVFHTGAMAGKFVLLKSNSGSVLTVTGGDLLEALAPGDFASVELPCYGNLLDGLQAEARADITGCSVWLWGAYSTYKSLRMKNCRFEAWQNVNNTGELYAAKNIYWAPHGLTVDDVRGIDLFSRTGLDDDAWHVVDGSKLDLITIQTEEYWWSNVNRDDCVPASEFLTRDIAILGGGNSPRRIEKAYLPHIAKPLPSDVIS